MRCVPSAIRPTRGCGPSAPAPTRRSPSGSTTSGKMPRPTSIGRGSRPMRRWRRRGRAPTRPARWWRGQRALEDAAIHDGRTAADEAHSTELEEQIRVLAMLLPLEREKTDRYLLTERARSDDALSNRDDFLGMVSHDLRNLLSGIVLSAPLMADAATGASPNTRAHPALRRAHEPAHRRSGRRREHRRRQARRSPRPADAATLLAEAIDTFGRTRRRRASRWSWSRPRGRWSASSTTIACSRCSPT